MILFYKDKDEDKREPMVLCSGSFEEAKEKLKKIVFGYGLVGEWKYVKLDRAAIKKLKKKYAIDTLYMLDPKEEVALV